jgi:hypothetical protein
MEDENKTAPDVISTELGIRHSFVKTSEFWGGGGLNLPQTPLVTPLSDINPVLHRLKEKVRNESIVRDTFILGERKMCITLLEVSQASPAHPSGQSRRKMI